MALSVCQYCRATMLSELFCWVHDHLWHEDDPRPCRLCCAACQEEGETASWDMPGTVIWVPKGHTHA